MEETKKEEEVKENKRSNKAVYVVIVVVLALLVLGLLAKAFSKKIGEKLAGTFLSKILFKGTANVDVSKGGNKVTYSGDEGNFSFEQGGALPESFPKDFPVYSGAKLASSWSSQGKNGVGVSAVWETSDSFDKVSNFFKSELAANGWKLVSTFEQTDSATYSFEKDKVSGFVGITTSSGKTTISVTVGAKE